VLEDSALFWIYKQKMDSKFERKTLPLALNYLSLLKFKILLFHFVCEKLQITERREKERRKENDHQPEQKNIFSAVFFQRVIISYQKTELSS
jgi:hypothetical protein